MAMMKLLPVLLLLWVVMSADASSLSSLSQGQYLDPMDYLCRNADASNETTVIRGGLIDRLVTNNKVEVGLCHLAYLLPFSIQTPSVRIPWEPHPIMVGGFMAMHLAMDMLNRGDGSVISELHGLNDRCPLRFTAEAFDSALDPNTAASTAQDLLQCKTSADNSPNSREICAFMGAARSSATVPMSILTGLAGRPQISPWSTSSQLDDKNTFPLFGRILTSDAGLVVPLIHILQARGIRHLGFVHWNDDYGTGYVRSLLQTATEIYPELQVVPVDLPNVDATQEDYVNVIDTLAKTQFRWFFGLVAEDDFGPLLSEAACKGIAGGDGEHVWIFNSGVGISYFTDGDPIEKSSPLPQAVHGVGFFSPQNGRPGLPIYDRFVEHFRPLNNSRDIAFINDRLPRYPDEPDFPRPTANPDVLFNLPESFYYSSVFDATILMGLAACAAYTQDKDGGSLALDGSAMFEQMLQTSFEGATGFVTLEPKTGSRDPDGALFRITNILEQPLNETHVGYTSVDSDIFQNGRWTTQVPYVYNNNSTRVPSDLPRVTTDYHFIGRGLRITGLVMAANILLGSLGFAGWTLVKRRDRVVRASQPIFLMILCIGTFVLGAAIIPLSVDDEHTSVEGCSWACMAAPWLASVGFAVVFAAFGSKLWRINRLFRQPSFNRIKVSATDVMAPLVVLTTTNLIVLSIWTAVSPLEWVREDSETDTFGRATDSVGRCTSDGFLPFVIILVVIDVGALILASYQSYLARGLATEFAESEHMGRAIACVLLVSFVGIPVIKIVSLEPQARFFVTTCIIFVLCSSVLLFIFVPKIMASRRGTFNANEAIRRSTVFVRPDTSTPLPAIPEATAEGSSGVGIRVLNNLAQLRRQVRELTQDNEMLQRRVSEYKALLPYSQESSDSTNSTSTTSDDAVDKSLRNVVGDIPEEHPVEKSPQYDV